jgi:PKD repeat protein
MFFKGPKNMTISKMRTTTIILLLYVLCMGVSCTAQPWMKPPYYNNLYPDSTKPVLLKDVQKAFEQWQEAHGTNKNIETDAQKGGEQEEANPGWMQFKRWENYMQPRVYPSGDISLPSRNYQNYKNYVRSRANAAGLRSLSGAAPSGNWIAEGPFGDPYGDGAGRINYLRFNPQNPNTMWVGSPSGGLWKSVDGANTWTSNTDALPIIGNSDLLINPIDTNVMYLATGDADGADTYSVGVLKSTDGGLTWDSTGLTWPVSGYYTIYKMLINPADTAIIIVASNHGLYRTADAGISWTLITQGSFSDIAFRPGDAATVYAVSNTFFISTDSGASFTYSGAGLPTENVQRMEIGVSAAAPNTVYVLASNQENSAFLGLYASTNKGGHFSTRCTAPNLLGYATDGSDSAGAGWYTLSIAVNPTNANDLYVGGVNHWRSTDGGQTWNCITQWYGCCGYPYVHADVHHITFYPGSGQTLYSCNDGGIFITSDNGTTWTDVSGNLQIAQMYRLGNSAFDSTMAMTGHQDNGSNFLQQGYWTNVLGGDGMECIIDYSNPNTMYAEYYYGDIYQTTDQWLTSNQIVGTGGSDINSNGAWVTPYIIHPTDNNTLLVGKSQIYRSTDAGATFQQVGELRIDPDVIIALAYAPSNPDYIYAATGSQLFVTTNGNDFTSITTGLPVNTASITYIAVSNSNPEKVWVTFSGYSGTQKVYESSNGGKNWTNYSSGLPNLPVNCIAYQDNTNDGLYVGTDAGVFFRSNTLASWQPFNTGLPNVVVDELELQYQMNKIRAATFGRGLWKSDLAIPTAAFSANNTRACAGSEITFTDQSVGSPTAWTWTLPGATPQTSAAQSPSVIYNTPGTYAVTLQVSNANGNETLTQNAFISIGAVPPVTAINASVCSGTYNFNGKQLTGPGNYLDTLVSAFGCDSVINLTLRSDTAPRVSLILPTDSFCTNQGAVALSGGLPPGGVYAGIAVSNGTFSPGLVSLGNHLITYTITGANRCTNTDTAYLSVEICAGLDQVEMQDLITVYPNPAGNLLNVESDLFGNYEPDMKIYDMTGREIVVPFTRSQNKMIASIADLAEGPYLIRIAAAGSITTKPFIRMK